MFRDLKFSKVSIAEYASIELIDIRFNKDWQKLELSRITRSSVHMFTKNDILFSKTISSELRTVPRLFAKMYSMSCKPEWRSQIVFKELSTLKGNLKDESNV